jgi:AmmeMemoRadiSam system protein A
MAEELSRTDQRQLLGIARRAIECALDATTGAPSETNAALAEKRGAFVTLSQRSDGALRGCIGYIEPLFPLAETISRAAVAAALHDNRFAPVTLRELPQLSIEISVLSVPQAIRPEDVIVGTHGLIVRSDRHSGLLLPQVASEYGWDRSTFLDHTCRKAGLAPGTWREAGVELLGFTATVFGEDEGRD